MENQELLFKFKEHLKVKHYSPKSIASYNFCLNKFFTYLESGQKSLKELTREDILAYQAYLKAKNYNEHTIERHLHSLKGFFKYLEEIFYILINPCAGLLLPRVPQRLPVVLSESEVKRLLGQPNTSTFNGIRDRAILEVLYSTGLRIGELCGLTIFDIDVSSGFLRVNRGKFSKDRFVPLTKAACISLKEYIEKVRPQFTKNRLKETRLFVGVKGRGLHPVLLAKMLRSYAKQAAIKKRVTCHTFRHTLATHLLANDVDIFKIQKILGHSRASITQIYTKVNPKQIKQEHQRHHPREKEKTPDG